ASSSYFDLNPARSDAWLFFSYVSLSEGIGIHPAYLSLFLAFSVLFLIYELPLLKTGFVRAALCALILYFSIFIVFLSSRIILLGLSVVFVAVLVRSIRTNQRSTAFAVAFVSLVFGFLIFLNPVSRYRSLQEINSSTFEISPHHQYTTAAQIRASLWWLAVKSVTTSNAFFGIGTGDVEKAMEEQGKQYAISNTIHSFDPHNQFLYTLLANGYPGMFLLFLCLGLPAFFGWIKRDYLLLGFLFLFCSLCLTESALELQKGIVFYSLFSALFFFHLNSFQTVNLDFRSVLHGGN
ncbi:MAG TPA: O-antigen ligase family protein, partial [Chryseosolibacter sp.]